MKSPRKTKAIFYLFLCHLFLYNTDYLNAQETFGAEQIITNEVLGPQNLFLGDLNGDGSIDVLTISADDDKISWYENLGNGNWGEQNIVSTDGDHGVGIYAEDLNGDGLLDILATYIGDQQLLWFENLGDGQFGDKQTISNSTSSFYVVAADLNQDGLPDVVTNSSFDEISWYENLGNGEFGPSSVISTGINQAIYVLAVDVNQDNLIDLVASSYNNFDGDRISWYPNLGAGVFGEEQVISYEVAAPSGIDFGDLNQDGLPDVISTSWGDDKLAWYENLGNGEFGEQIEIPSGSGAIDVSAKDIDQDGLPDLVTALFFGSKLVWNKNLGGGQFGEEQTIVENIPNPNTVVLEDLDADGLPELFSAISGPGDRLIWFENIRMSNKVSFSSQIDQQNVCEDEVLTYTFTIVNYTDSLLMNLSLITELSEGLILEGFPMGSDNITLDSIDLTGATNAEINILELLPNTTSTISVGVLAESFEGDTASLNASIVGFPDFVNNGTAELLADQSIINIFKVPAIDIPSEIHLNQEDTLILSPNLNTLANVIWSSNGDGSFENSNEPNTTYVPGPLDIENGEVALSLQVNNDCGEASQNISVMVNEYNTFVNNTFTKEILIYPNPFDDYVFLELFGEDGEGLIQIFDVQGKEVLRQLFDENVERINTAHLKPGVYHLAFELDRKQLFYKLVKIK